MSDEKERIISDFEIISQGDKIAHHNGREPLGMSEKYKGAASEGKEGIEHRDENTRSQIQVNIAMPYTRYHSYCILSTIRSSQVCETGHRALGLTWHPKRIVAH
jgi:hypothetical protein